MEFAGVHFGVGGEDGAGFEAKTEADGADGVVFFDDVKLGVAFAGGGKVLGGFVGFGDGFAIGLGGLGLG